MALRSVLIIATATVDVDCADDDVADAVSPMMDAALEAVGRAVSGTAVLARYIELDPATTNCGRCIRCGSWVTDRTQPEALADLPNGATHDNRLLCDEHLPPDHVWAF